MHPIIRGHRGHSYSFLHDARGYPRLMWLVFSWPELGAAAKMESSQEKEEPGCPGLCGGRRGQACLPAMCSRFPQLLPSPPSQFLSLFLTPPNFLFSPSPSQGVGCSPGIREGAWVRHGQAFPIFYFTSHVFILTGIREKPHKQLAHQGFISWTLLFRVRQIGKRAHFWSV